MLTLKVLTSTMLKQRPLQSNTLPDNQKYSLAVNATIAVESYTTERDHLRLMFVEESLQSLNHWYVFEKHVQMCEGETTVGGRLSAPDARTVRLNIPYKSQLDNAENPTGSCNVTSLAMCLESFGAKRKSSKGQFEDELYDYAEAHGLDRHSPHGLAMIVEAYGCHDQFRNDATIADVQHWLTAGKPVVIHGYFTQSGHIVVLVGFDATGFFVHDPYWGYDTHASGKYVHYSYQMITATCILDGSFWVHFLSR